MPPSPLRAGRGIEVLWEVTEDNMKQNVWWSATMSDLECVESSEEGSIGKWFATLVYEPMFGYDSTTARVHFLSTDQLEVILKSKATKHVRHYWRTNQDSISESPGPSRHSPEDSPMAVRLSGAQLGGQAGGKSSKKLAELYADLHARVNALQNAWNVHRCLSSTPDLSPEDIAARPLRYARHKLGELIDKPLPVGSSSSRMDQGNHNLTQSHLSVQVDCSLAEFRAICHVSKTKYRSSVIFHPHFPLVLMAKKPLQYEAKFHSFSILCSALGVLHTSEARESVKKVRVDRRSKAPIFVRIIGVLEQKGDSHEGPMALAVGHSILPEVLPLALIPTLYRSSRIWDAVDGIFQDPLQAKMMRAQDLADILLTSDGVSESSNEGHNPSDTHEGASCFKMIWNRTTKHVETTFADVRPEHVLGTLDISVPCVNIRGDALCVEVDSLCSIDFIKSTE